MKKTRVHMAALALLLSALLGGCGDVPYELTETEEAVIVNYSAHIVAKYNAYQAEGLAYVYPEEETETEEPAAEDVQDGEDTEAAEDAEITPQAPDVQYPESTLADLFGQAGIELDYVGARLASSYTQDDYYLLEPDAGKQYLVLGIDVTNVSTVPARIDYLSMAPKFEAYPGGGVEAKSMNTLLTNDFTVLEATLAPGETRETVILFQVPAETASLDMLVLAANNGTGDYRINLENE